MTTNNRVISVPIRIASDPLLDKIESTYNSSFPEIERRDFALLRAMIGEHPDFRMYAILQGDTYVGFLTVWEFEHFVYIEHFAIDESARNGGIGSRAMKAGIETTKLPIVLEVEVPADDLSRRRIEFYERLGFTLDTHAYQQPPYVEGGAWVDMRLMTFGPLDLNVAFQKVKETLYSAVYGV